MKTTELIAQILTALAEARAAGASQVGIAPLQAYLKSIDVELSEAEAAEQWNREKFKLLAPLDHQSRIEHFKSVLESGQTALKTLTTINGGAAVALLAFIGNVLSKGLPPGSPNPIPALNLAMLGFFSGIALAALSASLRYFTQFLGNGRSPKAANALNLAAIVAGFGSLATFVWGGLQVYLAFR